MARAWHSAPDDVHPLAPAVGEALSHRRAGVALRVLGFADVEASNRTEIERAIAGALARSGVAGHVVIVQSTVELRRGADVVGVDVGDWAEQWPLLPEEIRSRRVDAVADRLVAQVRGRGRRMRAVPGAWLDRLKALAVLALLATAAVVAIRWLRASNFFGPSTSEPTEAPVGATGTAGRAPPTSGPDRAAKVCEAARARVLAGGSLAGFDVEGWEAVVWLARPAGAREWQGALERQLRAGELADLGRSELGLDDPGTVGLERPAERSAMVAARVAAGVRLTGGGVDAFFDPGRRANLVAFSQRLVTDHGAEMAALYAQCAHLDTHDVGAWYYGRDDAFAVASLVFVSAVAANPRSSAADRYGSDEGGVARLVQDARSVSRVEIEQRIAKHGGSIRRVAASAAPSGEKAPPEGTHIAFPTAALTHAAAAARALLDLLGPNDGRSQPAPR